jgi:hypothetical protein
VSLVVNDGFRFSSSFSSPVLPLVQKDNQSVTCMCVPETKPPRKVKTRGLCQVPQTTAN